MNDLLSCLKEHEGFTPYVVQDSLGYWTAGYGKCLDKRKNCGLTQEEAQYLLEQEVSRCEVELGHFSWFTQLDTVRQEALIELDFNMGLTNLLKFIQMLASIEKKDFKAAAMHLLNSLWAKQVKENRANNVAHRLEMGSYA